MPTGWGRKYQYDGPPRKAMNAYSFYVQDWYRYWRRIIRTRNPHRVIAQVGMEWKRLDRTERQKYDTLAKNDKIRAREDQLAYLRMVNAGEILPFPQRQRKTKQPGYPRPTRNSYVFFSNSIRDKIRQEKPNMSYIGVMREIARRWRRLSGQEKKAYQLQMERDKGLYRAAKIAYRNRQLAEKRKKRMQTGRARLNQMFNQRVPHSKPEPEPPVLVVVE